MGEAGVRVGGKRRASSTATTIRERRPIEVWTEGVELKKEKERGASNQSREP